MQLNHGNIDIENPQFGARAYVEKAVFFGGIEKAALNDTELATELAGVKIPADGVVMRVDMANTNRDRHNELLPAAVLQKFANDINKEPFSLNIFHDRGQIVGLVLPKASVVPSGTGSVLKGYVFIYNTAALPTATTTGKGISLLTSIADGAIKDVSIEFRGYTQYISPESGNGRGVWQYEIDPERPEDTEFTGLAIVPKGAQRGASVVKSLDGGSNQKPINPENMQHYKDVDVVGTEKVEIKTIDEGGAIKVVGWSELVEKANKLHKSATDAEAAKVKAETDLAAIKADSDEVRKSLETDCINFGKLNGNEPKAEDLAKLSLKGLFDLREATLKEHDSPESGNSKSIKNENFNLKY